MLGESKVSTTIAVSDLDRAKEFYGSVLGLKQESENAGGITYAAGGGTTVFVYPSSSAGTNQATYASWQVDDLDSVVAGLKEKGVTFEQYDGMPGVTREGDIHNMGGHRAAWFTDPDGNILALDSES